MPSSWVRYLEGDGETEGSEGFLAAATNKSHNVEFMLYLLFNVVGGCFNYPVERLVNPSPDNESFVELVAGKDVSSRWTVWGRSCWASSC